jgi:outer membrane protein OmpA-like peptidoglycan-associated protein
VENCGPVTDIPEILRIFQLGILTTSPIQEPFVNRTRPYLFGVLATTLLLPLSALDDCEKCKDYPGLARMPGFEITEMNERQFDAYEFPIVDAGQEKTVSVEGRRTDLRYDFRGSSVPPSSLQILRNYQSAIRAIGGQVLKEVNEGGNVRNSTLRLRKGTAETWIWLWAHGDDHVYRLIIVERDTMKQGVVADAASMAGGLASSGRVAAHGIYFVTAKADIKPESEAALAEIVKLLQSQPALKLFVVGHTDMVGAWAVNIELSKRRAEAVVAALAAKGIPAERLTPQGVGPLAPAETNDTEEGRARNRGVELVKQ